MSQFDKLMSELNSLSEAQGEMTKALPVPNDGEDEKKIQAAAADGGVEMPAADGDDDEGDKEKGEKEPMTKSFTDADGNVVEYEDGTLLVKALTARVDAAEAGFAKAMEQVTTIIKGRDEIIKSLTDQVSMLSGQGRGRKAVLSIVEKPNATMLAKSEVAGISHKEFFAKAFTAQSEGRITGLDISIAETSLNRGEPIPAGILSRVMQ